MVLAPANKKAKLRRDRELAGVDVVYFIPNVEGIVGSAMRAFAYISYLNFLEGLAPELLALFETTMKDTQPEEQPESMLILSCSLSVIN